MQRIITIVLLVSTDIVGTADAATWQYQVPLQRFFSLCFPTLLVSGAIINTLVARQFCRTRGNRKNVCSWARKRDNIKSAWA
jgi:hypothetical protein